MRGYEHNKNIEKIKTCINCSRLFYSPFDFELCPECHKVMEERFDRVKAFIKENSGSDIPEISEACDVSQKLILRWVREERLFFTSDSGVGVPCFNCGTTIQTGRYCESCKARLRKDIQSVHVVKPEADGIAIRKSQKDRMRFLGRKNS